MRQEPYHKSTRLCPIRRLASTSHPFAPSTQVEASPKCTGEGPPMPLWHQVAKLLQVSEALWAVPYWLDYAVETRGGFPPVGKP